jgi:hypothetical protein
MTLSTSVGTIAIREQGFRRAVISPWIRIVIVDKTRVFELKTREPEFVFNSPARDALSRKTLGLKTVPAPPAPEAAPLAAPDAGLLEIISEQAKQIKDMKESIEAFMYEMRNEKAIRQEPAAPPLGQPLIGLKRTLEILIGYDQRKRAKAA